MSIKTFAIAAAAVATLATAATAQTSYFQFQEALEETNSVLELGSVTSAGNGIVEIYDYRGGELGALLGTESVRQGANADVRVGVSRNVDFDVIALLKVDGQTVATAEYDVE